MDKVQHFEIPADDMERAKKFYGEAFGWKLADVPQMNYTMAYTSQVDEKHMLKEVGVINGGMLKRTPLAQAPTIAVTVDDINASLEKIKAAGGATASDVMKVGDMGLYAYIKDTEGNVIGVWQNVKKP